MAYQRKTFTWSPTSSTLKLKSQTFHLRPTVTPNLGPVYLKIDTERELQNSNELGWNWHKSWNIPNISVKLNLLNEETTQWIDCQVQLVAVKLINDVFEEVGLEGVTQLNVVDGKAFFSGVKFNTTTYNHQGQRFQLLILLKNNDNIVAALQSPSVFVDSRKSARDEHRQIQYIQPFEPKYLERSFYKREKHLNDVIDAPIENNENGLHNYLTAPNIRNKIKHPLFMALKFSRCLSIYYEKNRHPINLLVDFQKQLMQKAEEQSDFMIVFQSTNNRIRRKIEESLTLLFAQSKVKVLERKHLDESLYIKLDYEIEDYQYVYPDLLEIMNQFTSETNYEQVQFSDEHQLIPSQIAQQVQHRKSAFKKFNQDFDKMPTKNFNEIQYEQQKEQNIRVMDNLEKIEKQVKIEEDDCQEHQQQAFSLNVSYFHILVLKYDTSRLIDQILSNLIINYDEFAILIDLIYIINCNMCINKINNKMSDSIQLESEMPDHPVAQPVATNLQELQHESKVLNTWAQSSKDLIDKYKNKFDAFKAMADQAGYIEQTKFSIGGEQKSEIFKKIDANGDGKITSDEWNLGWNNLDTQCQETQHKVQIAQQKMEILEALDCKIEPGHRLPEPAVVNTSYNNLLGQFKSATSLDDLTDLFNKKSPFRERNTIEEPLGTVNMNIIPNNKRASVRPIEALFQQYSTPNKVESDLPLETGSGKNTYLNNPVIPQVNIKLSSGMIQNSRFGFIQASPSTSFIQTSNQKDKKENALLNAKVQQSMNFNIEVKDHVKPGKRKDELNSFMGKLGLGKYEAPKVTINLEQPNAFDRLKHYVNNIGSTSAKRTPSSGLEELVNDKSFNTCTFKQQMKAYKKDKGTDRNDSQSRLVLGPTIENPLLQDQSLKSLHLKLIHRQRGGSQIERIPRN